MKTTTAADIGYACGCLTPYGQSITATTQGPCVNPEKHDQRNSIALLPIRTATAARTPTTEVSR